MLWFVSRAKNKCPPSLCFAHFYFPEFMFTECDCVIRCKWPPKGDAPLSMPSCVLNIDVNTFEDTRKQQEAWTNKVSRTYK